MQTEPFRRLDNEPELRKRLLPLCRLKHGEVWCDPTSRHRVGVLDAVQTEDVQKIFETERSVLSIQYPPYNIVIGAKNTDAFFQWNLKRYMEWSQQWVENNLRVLADNASLYIWLGADQREHFQPLPDFMILMRNYPELAARSFITMRNQRGYGTQKNWMAVRQECLYYTKGKPIFDVQAEYTDIPKILRGYYKDVNGQRTEKF